MQPFSGLFETTEQKSYSVVKCFCERKIDFAGETFGSINGLQMVRVDIFLFALSAQWRNVE